MSAYDDLMAFQRETEALGQIMGRLAHLMEVIRAVRLSTPSIRSRTRRRVQ